MRTLPVWADVARIDAEYNQRLQKALERPPARRRRPPLGIQPETWLPSRPIVPAAPRTGLRKRLDTVGSLSPLQRWQLSAQKAADELATEAV